MLFVTTAELKECSWIPIPKEVFFLIKKQLENCNGVKVGNTEKTLYQKILKRQSKTRITKKKIKREFN